MDNKKLIDEFKNSLLFEPTNNEIINHVKKHIDQKKKLKGGKYKFRDFQTNYIKIGGDGIPELVGYNLSSVWKDITHEKAEFYKFSIPLPKQEIKGYNPLAMRYSRTNLQEIERIIKTYMRKGDYVLENCCGWSTFGAMAAFYGYNGIGIDIWDVALSKSNEQLNEIKLLPGIGNWELKIMDGMNLQFDNNKFDYIYCNPPFMDQEKYSGLDNDIADNNPDTFNEKFRKLMGENFRVLKRDKLCTITLNDYRVNGYLYPLHIIAIQLSLSVGFKLWDIAIAELVKGRMLIMRKREYGKRRTAKQHEYVITFKKP